jgi:hypothetical protein
MPRWVFTMDLPGGFNVTREMRTFWSSQTEITGWIECLGHLTGRPQLVPVTHIEDTENIPGNLSGLAEKFPTPGHRETMFEVADVWDPPPRMVGMIHVDRDDSDDEDRGGGLPPQNNPTGPTAWRSQRGSNRNCPLGVPIRPTPPYHGR